MEGPGPSLVARVERLLGRTPVGWRRVSTGYTPAERWVVGFGEGSSAFLKHAVVEHTRRALRAESRTLAALDADFAPRVLAWEDGEEPLLVLEDLSGAHWPPPWSNGYVERMLGTLERVAAHVVPAHLKSVEDARDELTCWRRIAQAPEEFLSLGLAGQAWLQASLPALLDAEARAVLDGDHLLHFDVRSDNVCFAAERTVLVDWNLAARGNP